MKSFSLYVTDDLRNDPALFLQTLAQVCDLISLYNGPSLSEIKFTSKELTSDLVKGLKNDYAFFFQYDAAKRMPDLSYLHKGEVQLALTILETGKVMVQIPEDCSPTVELELRKALLKYTMADTVSKSDTASISPKFGAADDLFELNLPYNPGSLSNATFLQNMYEICSEFSIGHCPKFSGNLIQEEIRKETHERFYRLSVSHDNTSVQFEDYSGDSGSHSYPDRYNYEFFYREGGKVMIRVYRSGNELIFQTRFEDHVRFKMRVIQYFDTGSPIN